MDGSGEARQSGDATDEFAENTPAGADHAGRVRSSAGDPRRPAAARRIWQRSIRPKIAGMSPAGGVGSVGTQIGGCLGAPQQRGDVLQRGRSERRIASIPAIIEPAVLDQADRRVDDRHQRLGSPRGPAVSRPARPRKRLDVLRPVMPLAGARNGDRAQPAPADISVKRVELDPEPLGGISRGQQIDRYRLIHRIKIDISAVQHQVKLSIPEECHDAQCQICTPTEIRSATATGMSSCRYSSRRSARQ